MHTSGSEKIHCPTSVIKGPFPLHFQTKLFVKWKGITAKCLNFSEINDGHLEGQQITYHV